MYDLIVIGTGPGGYHAAIRAAQLGKKVLAVEAAEVGGVCLNVGCIPTKALLHAAGELAHAEQAAEFGLQYAKPKLELSKLGNWRDAVVRKMTGGVKLLFKSSGVELKRGSARLLSAGRVSVDGETIEGRTVIIATGSEPTPLPGFDFDETAVLSSSGALRIEEGVPKRFLAIGAGAIGLEFASIMNRFGAKVTVVEYMDQVIPGSDAEAAKVLARALGKQGVTLKTRTKAGGYEKTPQGLRVALENVESGAGETLVVDKILVAVGRRPRSRRIGLEEAGVRTDERGFITVNERMETGLPGVYAIGDVARGPLLAHKAMKEGLVAAENACGGKAVFDLQIPAVVYSEPEWASVGLSAAEAEARGLVVKTGKFPFTASGRAATLQAGEGFVKVVGEAGSDLLLGVQIVGPGASELIAEATLALELAATVEDLALTIHPHPTLSESVMEAAENLHKRAIHIANR